MNVQKKTKRIVATAAALALAAGMTFAETYETAKARTLQTDIGDISFGAWGRSTFEFGHQKTTTKITADATATGQGYIDTYNQLVAGYKAYTGSTEDPDTATLGAFAETAGLATAEQVTALAAAVAGVAQFKAMEEDTTDSSNYAALEPDWSYGNRIGFWIIGRTPDQKFGFDFNLDADGRALFVHKLWDSTESSADTNYNEDGKYAVAIGDQAKIWGLFDNPLFQTKVAFGRMRENELRGSIGDFGQRESSDVKSEDDIFQEIWTATGLFASVKGNADSPLTGFYANASIDPAGLVGITTDENGNLVSSSDSATDTDSSKAVSLYKAVRNFQGGVGYTIPGIAQIKAQYWGDSIDSSNYRYATSTYAAARKAGFGLNDYYGRMEFGIDWLGFMGGATSIGEVDLEKTPNASLIELGFKVPIVTDSDLRDYDPEKFYNWYSCLGTLGVIQKGFIMYKGHIWGGMGTSNLAQYSYDLVNMNKGDGADIFMAGVDFLTEICINPFGKQNLFLGLSGNYNITSASADGNMTYSGATVSIADLELRQHKFAAELYVKKTFAANNFMFAGIAGNWSIQTMDGTVADVVDLSYKSTSQKFYMPIGVELFF